MNRSAVCTRASTECDRCGRPKCDRCGRCKSKGFRHGGRTKTFYCPSNWCRFRQWLSF